MRNKTLGDTLHRIQRLIKQHDEFKRQSMNENDTANQFLGISDLDSGYTYDKHYKRAIRLLNVAKWIQRTMSLHMKHLEDLPEVRRKPEVVSFT